MRNNPQRVNNIILYMVGIGTIIYVVCDAMF